MSKSDIVPIVIMKMEKKVLFIAYGNPDREDDGVAWHVLKGLAKYFGIYNIDWNDDFYSRLGTNPDFFFILQLTPELQDLIINYEYVCFIDAHLGAEFKDVELKKLKPKFEPSTLSHHMTPQFLMDITRASFNTCPEAVLLTIRGFEFQFKQQLTAMCQKLAEKAINLGVVWYEHLP